MIIEGRNAVIEALRARMPLEHIMVYKGAKPDKSLDEIVRQATRAHVSVLPVEKRELDRLSDRGAHQGVMAKAAPYQYSSLDEIMGRVARSQEGASLVIVLDHITDPGNFGAIVRTAEVIGAAGVVVPKKRTASLTPAAWKSAAGAFAHVAVAQESNIAQSLKRLKDAGFWVAGASEHASQNVWEAPLEGKIALVMGSEGDGLARLTRETCDFLVKLPQVGKVGSLNVAQACTAISYEWLRRANIASPS